MMHAPPLPAMMHDSLFLLWCMIPCSCYDAWFPDLAMMHDSLFLLWCMIPWSCYDAWFPVRAVMHDSLFLLHMMHDSLFLLWCIIPCSCYDAWFPVRAMMHDSLFLLWCMIPCSVPAMMHDSLFLLLCMILCSCYDAWFFVRAVMHASLFLLGCILPSSCYHAFSLHLLWCIPSPPAKKHAPPPPAMIHAPFPPDDTRHLEPCDLKQYSCLLVYLNLACLVFTILESCIPPSPPLNFSYSPVMFSFSAIPPPCMPAFFYHLLVCFIIWNSNLSVDF